MTAPPSFTDALLEMLPHLRGYARALTRDRTDADDLVQETLTKALRYHDRFAAGTQLRAWLFTILRNTHFTAIKKVAREATGAADCVAGQLTVEPNHDVVIAHKETLAAIERLPGQYREMLILVVMLGESYENAAVICNCAIGTVKSRVNRARRLVMEDLSVQGRPPITMAAGRR